MQDNSKVDRLSYERNIDLQEILFRECNQADDQNISPHDEQNEVKVCWLLVRFDILKDELVFLSVHFIRLHFLVVAISNYHRDNWNRNCN